MFTNPKFWLLTLLALTVIGFLALKAISFSGKKPQRPEAPATLPPCPDSPNCVCSEDPRDSHNIAALKFEGKASAAWSQLQTILNSLGGKEIKADERYLWFEFRTPLIGFTDDLECRLNPEAQQIEIRSASRAGHSDLGANRKRVEKIRAAFSESS